jgi:hypothetical protein
LGIARRRAAGRHPWVAFSRAAFLQSNTKSGPTLFCRWAGFPGARGIFLAVSVFSANFAIRWVPVFGPVTWRASHAPHRIRPRDRRLRHLSAAQARSGGYRGRWNDWNYDAMVLSQGVWRITVPAVAPATTNSSSPVPIVLRMDLRRRLPLAQIGSALHVRRQHGTRGTPGLRYTFALEDADSGAQSRMIVQETATDPVAVTSVAHVLDGSNAVVTIGTSAAPSAGERIFVRGSFDNWTSSSFFEASGAGTNWTATIVPISAYAGRTCAFHVLTTTVATPTHADAPCKPSAGTTTKAPAIPTSSPAIRPRPALHQRSALLQRFQRAG